MQRRNWILLAIAVVLGLAAVLIANSWFSGMKQEQEQALSASKLQETAQIVVATQPLGFGASLTNQNVRLQDWPTLSVPEGAFRTVPEALKNSRVALRPMVPGEPVLASNVSGAAGRATLAALLPPGMRAVSVPVDAIRGVAGFVLPGTSVDVILTRQIKGEGARNDDLRSDLILENVQVLAVDQLSDDTRGEPKVSKTATLAVSLFDAQRLAVAEKLGTVSLALRKAEDVANITLAGEGPGYSTVTGRELGGRSLFIPAGPSSASQPFPVSTTIVSGPSQVIPSAPARPSYNGPSMVVVRGTDATSYPVSDWGGR